MPPQRRCQRLGRTGSIAQSPARGRQAQPGLPHIALGTDRLEQRHRPHIVVAKTGRGQRQRQRPITRRQAAAAVEPTARLDSVPRGNLGLPAL
jgi:prophage tail gpP-like protein